MPGIWGLYLPGQSDAAQQPGAMRIADRLRHSDLYTSAVVSGSGYIGGVVSLPEVQAPAWTDPAGDLPAVVVDGEIYDAELRRREITRTGATFQTEGPAELLSKGWRLSGPDFLRSIEGYFSAALWDPKHQQLVVITDRFGMRPLYYTRVDGGVVFASEVKALLAFPGVDRTSSLNGVAQFMTFGQLLGQDTLVEGIKTVPAACQLSYDRSTGRITEARYAGFTQKPLISDEGEALTRLDEAFGRAVARRTAGTVPLGLSLSGGLDGRTILATAARDAVRMKTVSLGIPGCIDHRAAMRLASLSGQEHHEHHLGRSFLDNFAGHLEQMTFLTDGHYLDQGITVPTLGVYRDLGIHALLRGHAGELFHMDKAYAFSVSEDELDFRSTADVERWLWTHLTRYMIDGVGMQLFRRELRQDAEAAARNALREALQEVEGIGPPAQALWLLFVTQRLRRETALSMQMFNAHVQVRMPYVDAELVDLVMQVPPTLKMGERIQTFILQRRFPAFLGVVNANTGSPVGASRTARRLSLVKLRIFSKLRVPGYQPYERLGLWLSRDLQPYVRSVLLAPESLDGGLLDPDVVRRIVDDHALRRRNHTFAIMAMLILQLGPRVLAARSGVQAPRVVSA